jgi:C1A family cysteine protease
VDIWWDDGQRLDHDQHAAQQSHSHERRMNRTYGFRKSPPDERDKIAAPPDTILREVDLRTGPMPQVFDQGQLGSCTANAVAAALQFDLSLDLATRRARRRSRLDLYYGERSLEGELGQGDTGAYGRDGFKFAQQTGVLLEERWPYDITTYAGPPPSGYKRYKLTKPYAHPAQDVDTIKAILSNNQTVAFGFTVYESFESDEVASTGIVPMPKSGESQLGGHEMLLVGYLNAHPGYFLARNSWGSSFGIGGYVLMPEQYITDASLTSDLRTVVRATT